MRLNDGQGTNLLAGGGEWCLMPHASGDVPKGTPPSLLGVRIRFLEKSVENSVLFCFGGPDETVVEHGIILGGFLSSACAIFVTK